MATYDVRSFDRVTNENQILIFFFFFVSFPASADARNAGGSAPSTADVQRPRPDALRHALHAAGSASDQPRGTHGLPAPFLPSGLQRISSSDVGRRNVRGRKRSAAAHASDSERSLTSAIVSVNFRPAIWVSSPSQAW